MDDSELVALVARLKDDYKRHDYRYCQKAASAIELLHAELNAWKDYALHQECCADCAESVHECDIGFALRAAAMKSKP